MDKRQTGLVITAVALVAVLAAALVGYRAFASRSGLSATSAQATEAEPPSAGSSDTGSEPAQSQSQDAPEMLADYDATVYTELGEPVLLSSLADGKPLVINFWATWCPYCVQEMPDFRELYRDYADRVAFAFVDSTDGTRETVEKAAQWLADHDLADLPAYYDTDSEATYAFGAWSLPTTVVVSAEGEILTVSPGMIDAELMRASLDTLV